MNHVLEAVRFLAIEASPTPGFTNPNHISGGMLRFFEVINEMPMLGTLLVLMGLDIVSGLALSIYNRKLSSVISWRGMSRKVFMLLIVAMAALIEQFTGGIPVSKLAAVCYIFTEAISILENAAMAGVPLPVALVNALTKMKADQKTITSPTNTTITQKIEVATARQVTQVSTAVGKAEQAQPE